MRQLPMLLLAALLAGGLSVASVGRVLACTCLLMAPHEALAAADVVVEGVVVGVTPPERASVTYSFSVEQVLKGDASSVLEIVTFQDSAACGLNMGVGQRWRLNLESWDGQLHTSLCSGSERLTEVVPLPSPPAGGTPDPGWPLGGLFFAFGSGLMGVLALLIAWLARGSIR